MHYLQADKYACGLLKLRLIPGKDCIALVGCVSLNCLSLWVAAMTIGVGFMVSARIDNDCVSNFLRASTGSTNFISNLLCLEVFYIDHK